MLERERAAYTWSAVSVDLKGGGQNRRAAIHGACAKRLLFLPGVDWVLTLRSAQTGVGTAWRNRG